jgi:steroid 5-alpha reductase family enzyme
MYTEIALLVLLYMTLVFILALIAKDNSIADIFWGPGFILVAIYSLIQDTGPDLRKYIVTFLVALWGIRLAVHVFLRNRGKGEDFRYRNWRETWKLFVLRSYFQIFLLQGFIMYIIAFPVFYINFYSNEPLGFWDTLGLVVYGTGFFIESVADYQLVNFKKDPANKGKLMQTGLWEISRHPNYFGESLIWWGISIYALSLPHGWMTMLSPVIVTLLLRYISGVPMLEKKYEGRPGWDEYKSRTAPFIPYVKFF